MCAKEVRFFAKGKELAQGMRLRSGVFPSLKRVWLQNSAGCSRILFASPEIMLGPRSHSPLHFDIRNIEQIK